MSRNQLNQKLKLIVEAPWYVIYSNTPPHTRALWARSVNVAQAFFKPDVKYSTWIWGMIEIWTCDLLSHLLNILRKQLNQKLWCHVREPTQSKALIPCQETNSTKSLSWWLRPQNILYIPRTKKRISPYHLWEGCPHSPRHLVSVYIPA